MNRWLVSLFFTEKVSNIKVRTPLTLMVWALLLSGFKDMKDSCQYEKIQREIDCDIEMGKWEAGIMLGILPVDLTNVEINKKDNVINVTGRLVEKKTLEPISGATVYRITYDELNCNLTKQGGTDSLGNFNIFCQRHDTVSLYFKLIGMEGIELKINCR